jgi:hypothetical protein
MRKIALIWRTVRHLTIRQVAYQLLVRCCRRPSFRLLKNAPVGYFVAVPESNKLIAWHQNTFTFLNQSVSFPDQIDWNYAYNGKLWTYHLNYFDFLNQPDLLRNDGIKLMNDFMSQTNSLRDGLEPYPTSLRITNWIHFLSRHHLHDAAIDQHLFAQLTLLRGLLEYHLAGNHLLANGFSLLIGALYFRHNGWFNDAKRLIETELNRQILPDGGHNERSPMYHQLLLDRLLDVLPALQHDSWHNNGPFVQFLAEKATRMLDWLNAVTFHNGNVPMVNDAAFGVAPTTAQLRQKARRILVNQQSKQSESHTNQLTKSGYRLFRRKRYELFADVGAIGPDHQPGHAHADTFSFVLYVDNSPIIVDTGTSTYQINDRRAWERSTAAHNTVEVGARNSSEVWAGFRVGRRARVTLLTDSDTELTARHDGYAELGVIHERTWIMTPNQIRITDQLLRKQTLAQSGVARFYFHPTVKLRLLSTGVVAGSVQLRMTAVTKPNICVKSYELADGFDRLKRGRCLEVRFTNQLETTITLLDETTLPDVLL